MEKFPSVSPPNVEYLRKIIGSLNSGKRPADLKREVGGRVYDAIRILKALGIIEPKRKGRWNYYRKKGYDPIDVMYLRRDDVRKTLTLIANGVRNRKNISSEVYHSTSSTDLRRVSSIVSLGRQLGFVVKGRAYKLTDNGLRELLRYFIEAYGIELSKSVGVSYVSIAELRNKVLAEVKVPREVFDTTLLELNRLGALHLSAGPVTSEEEATEGIQSDKGVLLFLRIEQFKYLRPR